VSNDDHAAVVDILDDPFGKPYHDEGLARTLCIPDDTTLAVLNALAGGDVRKILVMATDLLDSRIINHKVVYERKKPLFLAERHHAVTQTVDFLNLQQLDFS